MATSCSYNLLSNVVHHDECRVRPNTMTTMSRSRLQVSSFLSTNAVQGRLSLLSINHGAQRRRDATVLCASVPPGSVPLPTPPPSSSSWKNWVVGVFLSIILPLWKNKSTPFLLIKHRVESVVETMDTMAEIIEQVAEEVEKVADHMADQLPEGSLKNAVSCVEHIAHEAAKDAHMADEFLDKVVEVEQEMLKDMESQSTKKRT